jgi:hypothetical protein
MGRREAFFPERHSRKSLIVGSSSIACGCFG